MSDDVGVVRDATGLTRALATMAELETKTPDALPLLTARLIAASALARHESRGGHYRSDYPDTLPEPVHTRLVKPAEVPMAAE